MRAARAAILVFLGAFMALILYTVWRAPDSSPAVPPPHPVPEAPEEMPVTGPVESAAETFHFTEERGGVVVTRLQAGKMLGIEGGSRVLSDILIELRPYPETEPDRLARIRGDAGRFDAAAHEVVLQGNVEVRMATGEELTAPILRYRLDERVARTDSEVGFGLDGAAGTARGLEADLANQRLRLAENVRLEAAAEDGEPVSIAADELRYDGQAGRLHLGGAVEISGDWGVFQGREMVFETGDEQSNSGVSREPGRLEAVAGESGTLILRAESWTFEFDEARNIQGVVASGNARLEPLQPGTSPFRELKAQRIRFEPAEQPGGHQRLEAFAGEGAPVQAYLEEESLRAVTSDRLTLLVGPDDEGRATFEGDVRASGPARAATGHRLVLLEDHSAILSGSAERPARVMEIGHVVAADVITFMEDGSGRARGHVRIDVEGGKNDEDRPRLAAVSDEADFSVDEGHLTLTGNVRTWQGEDSLEAAWVRLERPAGRVLAGGGITMSIRSAGGGDSPVRASQRLQIRADSLLTEETPQRVTFEGHVRMVQGPAVITAQRLELEEDDEEGRRLLASGDVHFQDHDWRGSGERLRYDAAEEVYLLESSSGLAEVISNKTGASLRGRSLRVDTDGEAVLVESEQGGRVTVRAGGGGRTP